MHTVCQFKLNRFVDIGDDDNVDTTVSSASFRSGLLDLVGNLALKLEDLFFEFQRLEIENTTIREMKLNNEDKLTASSLLCSRSRYPSKNSPIFTGPTCSPVNVCA